MVLEAKKCCYPENIQITDYSGDVKLQSLLDHTIERLASVQMEVLQQVGVGINTLPTLNFIFKMGLRWILWARSIQTVVFRN